ncbi:MAG: 50S ribosomal protein L29 [Candidatus Latescibacterota bacterium]|nr:MAG: 50S ribosomal protein L29 [Candidatus Latescibacterota bacterium]
MKTFKMREMSAVELKQKMSDLREELFNLRFASATRALDNPLRMRQIRREIATIETILREDERKIRPLGAGSTRTAAEEKK